MVYVNHLTPGFVPGYAVDLGEAFIAQIAVDSRIVYQRIYGVGHSVDIPIVGFYHIVENLGTSLEMMEGTPICMASNGEMPNGSDTEGIM